MITNIGRIAACVFVLALVPACVKIQIKPQDMVKDTVSAGKSLYETIKHKKDGTEERLYTHVVKLDTDADQQTVGTQCLEYLETNAVTNSKNKIKILEQSTEILNSDVGDKLKCTMRAAL